MQNNIATTKENAIVIHCKLYENSKVEETIMSHIENTFGKKDGSYFIKGNQEVRDIKGDIYKILLVEDSDNITHQLYFRIIRTQDSKLTSIWG